MNSLPMRRVRRGLKSASRVSVLRPLVSAMLLTLSGMNLSQAGDLTYLGVQENAGGSQGLGRAVRVAISPDNKNAYVAAVADRGLGVFTQSAGVVSQLDFYPAKNSQDKSLVPLAVVVSGDGKNVYAAVSEINATGGWVLGYSRAVNGSLSELPMIYGKPVNGGTVNSLDNVNDLIVSADGRNVYVTTGISNSVIVFSRDTVTGQLTYLETQSDGVNGIDGLAGASGLSLSADGKHLYVTGTGDNAIAVFARNTATGQLSFVELQRDNTAGVDGLAGVKGVALSPDGANLYAAGSADDAVSVFKRDPSSGKLTFLEVWKDGINGVDGLNGASTVVVSPNGSRVFVGAGGQVGTPDNAITVFKRLPQNGKLEFVEFYKDGVNGVDGLQGVQSIALNSTGAYLFAAAPTDGTGKVSVFKTANRVPQPSADTAEVATGESVIVHVLANDTDPENDLLRVSGADDKSKQGGIVTVNADNTITYTAPENFTGTDTFNYFVSDVRDATPQVGVVTITVKAANGGSAPSNTATGNAAPDENSGGGGSVDAWLGLMLLVAGRLGRRTFN